MPDWRAHLRTHLDRLALDGARAAEIAEELSQHLDERYEALRHQGHSDSDARRLALDELDSPGPLAEQLRPLRQASVSPVPTPGAPARSFWHDTVQDLRYSVRLLRRQPVFALIVVATLALGIGANGAFFALVDATLLRPLPFPDPGRLVQVWERTPSSDRGGVSPLNMRDWADRSAHIESIGAYVPNVGGMVLGVGEGLPETVSRQWISVDVFTVLGVAPVVGRTFVPEDQDEQRNVVVLAESFWRERFGAEAALVGRTLRLDGDAYTVVGVVPDEARLLGRSDLWALLPLRDLSPEARAFHPFLSIARLRDGASLEAAQSDVDAVAAGLAREFPATNADRGVRLEPLRDAALSRELRQTAVLFVGVVGLVLLICCVNVATLILTRGTVRQRELAIRSALGADRRRLVRQLLTESLVLAALGGLGGLLVGAMILRAAPAIVPPELLPAVVTLSLDARVVGFCAVTALVVGMVCGLFPARHATSMNAAETLSGTRAITGRGGRVRALLVAAQVAMAVLLLCGAGLLLRTLRALDGVERGYDTESVLSMVVDPMGSTYPTDADELRFYDAVAREIRALPGVGDMAWATTLPLGPSYQGDVFVEVVGEPWVGRQLPTADQQIVSPSYFTTLGIPILEGRAFDDRDVADATAVCLVNEAFVARYFGGRSPIGRDVALRDTAAAGESDVCQVVGVARQVKGASTEVEAFVQIYVPLAQQTPGDIFLLVTPTNGPAAALATPVREAIARVDTAQLVSVRRIMTLDDVLADANATHRFRAVLVAAFAGLGLVLAMVGLFGVLAYWVQQRIRDLGVRRALGASTTHVLGLVARQGLAVIGIGALVGLGLATIAGRLIATLLFGVEPFDLVTFAGVTAVIIGGAAASMLAPAWRAAGVEPATALRQE